jgi:hypothetical protein
MYDEVIQFGFRVCDIGIVPSKSNIRTKKKNDSLFRYIKDIYDKDEEIISTLDGSYASHK